MPAVAEYVLAELAAAVDPRLEYSEYALMMNAAQRVAVNKAAKGPGDPQRRGSRRIAESW
jgi:hypothetical protein